MAWAEKALKVDPDTGEHRVETYLMRVDVRTGEELGEVVEQGQKPGEEEYNGHVKKLRAFDAGMGRWVAVDAPAPEAAPPVDANSISLVTYNIWFGPRTTEEAARFGIAEVPEPLQNREKRTAQLIAQLRHEDPDVVCLQEVQEGEKFLDVLLANEWIRANYRVAHAVRGATLAYGLAALVRSDKFPSAVSCQVHDFTGFTVHNRIVMLLELQLGSAGAVFIANTHLDSLGECGNRMKQLHYILAELGKSPCDLLMVGDMNMTEASEENAWLSSQQHGFLDLGHDAGATMEMDDHTGQPERIDRIFHRPARLQVVEPVRVLGREVADRSARPSDHFGLSVKLGA